MMNDREVLSLVNVSVRYEGSSRHALQECSFAVREGERVALLGLNGSGKTSLLMAVAGLLPYEGTIAVDGIELSSKTLGQVRRKIGFLFSVPDDQLLFPRVVDDVAFSLTRQGVDGAEARRRSQALLSTLGVGDLGTAAPYELSHGQKTRVALAGILVHEPRLLLLDEPSGALDPPGKRDLAGLFTSHPAAMLIATHDLAFAGECCTRFILLEGGRVTRDSPRIGDITL